MQKAPTILSVLLLSLLLTSACRRPAPSTVTKSPRQASPDSIKWLDRDLDAEGMKVAVGHRRAPDETGNTLEPIVVLTKNNEPLAGAMVFLQLLSGDGAALGEDMATVYEPAWMQKPACYTAKLSLPADVKSASLRVRIILPDSDKEWSKEIAIY